MEPILIIRQLVSRHVLGIHASTFSKNYVLGIDSLRMEVERKYWSFRDGEWKRFVATLLHDDHCLQDAGGNFACNSDWMFLLARLLGTRLTYKRNHCFFDPVVCSSIALFSFD